MDASHRVVNLQTGAVELAHQFSSLQQFRLAAAELLTCETLSSTEIDRHSRKIITLLEIAQSTLTKLGCKLYSFARCSEDLVPYKASYFELLRMLKRIKHNFVVEDPTFQDRINRLLLPLSTYLRTPATEEMEYASPASGSSSPRIQSHSSPRLNASSTQSHTMTHLSTGVEPAASMPPPDMVRTATSTHRHNRRVSNAPPLDGRQRGRPPSRPIIQPETPLSDEEEDVEPLPIVIRRPRARLGILCTKKHPMHHKSHDRSLERSFPMKAH
ncbi:hypothetical protein C8Q75DRAFT_758724 [Abortiporus biennis]|nr:hypothetical protein C8Q75DRAFT_758724 [Abortiporus biennis]